MASLSELGVVAKGLNSAARAALRESGSGREWMRQNPEQAKRVVRNVVGRSGRVMRATNNPSANVAVNLGRKWKANNTSAEKARGQLLRVLDPLSR